MHESGLVEDLIYEVEKVSRANGGGRVTSVEVGVGELAGFSAEHFAEHFKLASCGTLAAGADLVITICEGDALTLGAVDIEDA